MAREDNQAKQQGLYVDLKEDGTFTVPHKIDRPLLRSQIWETADMIKWFLVEDHFLASITGGPRSPTHEVESLLADILERGPDG